MWSDFFNRAGHLLILVPTHLASHLMITVIALAAGLAISLPLGVALSRRAHLRYPVMTAVSVIQTIPSLALLALMVPVLVGVGALMQWTLGVHVSALGFWPTVISLTLYSMLPIVRNTVTGILGIDPAVKEAATGVGMTPSQVLWKVELPLAAPVILAGIRTATVWVVGIATLSTPVGQRSLGNFIFKGLQTQNWAMVMVGCVTAALLAVMLDMLIGGLEKAVEQRRRALGAVCGALLAAVLVLGLTAPALVRAAGQTETGGRAVAVDGQEFRLRRPIRVGAKTFTEQFILAQLIQNRLQEAGYDARRREGLGSTVVFDSLAAGEIDVYVDYSGTIWANHMGRQGSAPAAVVLDEVTWWLATNHSIRCLGSLGFENSYALAMPRRRAQEMGLRTIADLADHSPELVLAGDYEFFGRPEWRSLRDAYALRMKNRVEMDSTFMYLAVSNGEVDVISAFSSDGRIAAFDLVTLTDPGQVIPPYDAIVLLSAAAAEDGHLVRTLRGLIGRIPVEAMRDANYRVDRDRDKQSVAEAALWLAEQVGTP